MCGIAGVYGACDEDLVRPMVESMAHRGPDDSGLWISQSLGVTLGHSRLSIVDLSAAGHQPMSYADGRLCIAYNGEIYNHLELREELERKGHRFQSRTDTEVVLAAFAEWGVECLHRLRGMFALAIADLDPPAGCPELLLARDRLGIKPLLLARDGPRLWFASELRALVATGRVGQKVDHEALLDYLAVGAVFQPRTILEGVEALPPGSYLALRRPNERLVRYWDLHRSTASMRAQLKTIGTEEASMLLRAELERAARYHLIADVPVGAFLSGGIDSTAIVGLMGRASGQPIRTFSVGFESASVAMDERRFARLAADYLHADHHEVVVTSSEAATIFPKVVSSLDQPSVDGTNTWIVSRAARSEVTVALSGLGGDEVFAGYQHFAWFAERFWDLPLRERLLVPLVEKALSLRPTDLVFRQLFRLSSEDERLALLRRLLANHALGQAVQARWSHDSRRRLARRQSAWTKTGGDAVQRATYGEVNGYLLSTLLRDVDAMSMAHALEVRPVLLDHKVVELGYSLPASHKLHDGRAKIVLTNAMRAFLPPEVVDRKKVGFELPFVAWMGGELRDRFTSLLATPNARSLFHPFYLRRMGVQLRARRPPRALWAWGILLAWLEQMRLSLA